MIDGQKIKKYLYDFSRWMLISELFSLVVLIASVILRYVRMNGCTTIVSIIRDLTSHGESFIFCIPLIAGLLVEFAEKKDRTDKRFTFIIGFFGILLLCNGFGYMIVTAYAGNRFLSFWFITIIPLFFLNFSAFVTITFSNAADNAGKRRRNKVN